MDSDGTNRRQRKNLDAARKLAGPRSDVLAYASGSGHARMSKGFIGLVTCFILLFAIVLVVIHAVVIPGAVIIVVAIGLLKPRRGLALTSDAVLVFHESIWSGRPNRLTSQFPISSLMAAKSAGARSSRVNILFGAEGVSLKEKEFERLLRAAVPAVERPPA
jgi:hypothetical protein